MKKKLFSITKKDFEVQVFRAGGKGGQAQNKLNTGVRIIHKESGARGESRNHASQYQNKKEALKRLTQTSDFKLWLNRRSYEISQGETIEQEVEKMMDSKQDFKIEIKEDGRWVDETK